MRAVTRASALLVTVLLSSSPACAGHASAPQQRSEEEDYKDVPADLVFMHGANPAAPGNCLAAVFVPFKDDLKGWDPIGAYDAVSSAIVYDPPYDDAYSPYPGVVWTPPPGYHWVKISQSSRSGATPNDCSDFTASQQATHGTVGYLTYKITDECDFARDDVRDAEKAVKKAQKKVANTTGKPHDKAVTALKRAKSALKKAKKTFKKHCSA